MAGYRVRRVVDTLLLGPQRRRLTMSRRLRRLNWDGTPVVTARPAHARRGLAMVVVAAAVAGGVTLWQWPTSPNAGPRLTAGSAGQQDSFGETTSLAGAPAHTHLDDMHRLLPEPTQRSAATSSYRFMREADSGPVTFEPCRPIRYVVHRSREPRAYDRILRRSIREISRATGLRFIAEGSTAELPAYRPSSRPAYQPAIYGDRWAPVLIAWSNTQETPQLANASGRAGPTAWGTNAEPLRYVSGVVAFDVPKLEIAPRSWVRTTVLHELGHLVGLAHVKDHHQIMWANGHNKTSSYGDGDLAGLSQLGTGPCFADH